MPFRRRGFSPLFAVYYHRDLHWRPVHWTSRPSFCPAATPPYPHRTMGAVSPGLGGPLRPVNFRGPQPRRVSCYALLSRWLLLSLRPRCLWLETPFSLSLSGHLGALTRGLGCSLLGPGAYPQYPTPGIFGAPGFGVRKGSGASSAPCFPIGALPRQAASPEAVLRDTSGGTSYHRARLAFNP